MTSRTSFRPTFQAASLVTALFVFLASSLKLPVRPASPEAAELIGPYQPGPTVRHITPDNHVLTPAGIQVELPGLRPNALALSPDGKLLVAAGTAARLVCVDPGTGRIRQEVALPGEDQLIPAAVSPNILSPDPKAKLSYTGLIFSPDGTRLFLANVNGSIKVFAVGPDHSVTPSFTIPLHPANAPERQEEIPAGLAISRDGRLLYVALNLSNGVAEVDIASGKTLRRWDVGVAPCDVALAGNQLYVSNWGGRRPGPGDLTGPAGQGTLVRVDEGTSAAKEGSVSVIDLPSGKLLPELVTGRHASSLAVHPSGHFVVCACAADDFLAVIDTRKHEITEKIWPKRTPADLFGASPNALAFSQDGRTLYCCNGTQNAVAVVGFEPGKCELEGLIPTAWYPGGVVFDAARQRLHVANIKGLGSWRRLSPEAPRKYISSHHFGTLSLIDLPVSKDALKAHSATVLANARGLALQAALQPARPGMAPRPVPERSGEPSVFKHVIYIIKENRTYDQVLGDMPGGNGDPLLCIFGENITPNQHQLCRDFVLLDNTYCSGVLSADGHNWSCSAITTDYVERSFSGWPRSYPDGFGPGDVDSLAWAPTGFIWDHARRAGHEVRIFGEFAVSEVTWRDPDKKGAPQWADHWQDFRSGAGAIRVETSGAIASVEDLVAPAYPAWEDGITDVARAEIFIKQLKEWETTGRMPGLIVMSLPMDHTTGTKAGFPTPAARVADNDLAFGKIVEALSHSRFWQDTCLMAIEDDPQNGWDHVSAYRTTAYVLSAWTKRKAVVHTQYNQTSLLRTIGLILGLKPMHELDAIATPLGDCFTDTPDFTPWQAVPNRQPLDEMNPNPRAMVEGPLKQDALLSATLPFEKLDACPEGVLNGILWRAAKGTEPFPIWAEGSEEEDAEE
jgi:DNA-binding beta-propeller fold protein YncE